MKKIISINQPSVFSLSSAHNLLPVIYRITELAHNDVKALMNRMQSVKSSNPVLAAEIEIQIDQAVSRWEMKIEKLGATPKGLWLADFDNGKGYFCWKFPETTIRFCHGYNDGFSGRQEIDSTGDEESTYQEIFREP